jgi:hypothetical protein
MNKYLDKIKARPRRIKREKYTKEQLELAVEWITGKISNSDYCFATDMKNRGSVPYVESTKIIRNAVMNNEVKIIIKK